jgi:putative transposase
MPRAARIIIPGSPHHVTQKGIFENPVFFTDNDRSYYLENLKFQCEKHRVKVLSYFLMTNHVHFVMIPSTEDGMSHVMRRIQAKYSLFINNLRNTHGHLWQDRFFSCPMSESHFVSVIKYVDRNPVRAGMVKYAGDYPWSSARAHESMFDPFRLIDMDYWQNLVTGMDWKSILLIENEKNILDEIREHTRMGKPLGGEKKKKDAGIE